VGKRVVSLLGSKTWKVWKERSLAACKICFLFTPLALVLSQNFWRTTFVRLRSCLYLLLLFLPPARSRVPFWTSRLAAGEDSRPGHGSDYIIITIIITNIIII